MIRTDRIDDVHLMTSIWNRYLPKSPGLKVKTEYKGTWNMNRPCVLTVDFLELEEASMDD